MSKGKHMFLAALMFLTILLATGCGGEGIGFTLDPQELYRLPKLPVKYTDLNSQLTAILDSGAEYAAPASGSNNQPVQMWDLDGDGREEALAFFRNSTDEKPLKIYICKMQEDSYEQIALIEGSGTAIHSISYTDMNGDGRMELAVSWRVSTDLLVLSIYDLQPDGPVEIVRTTYVRYNILDMNGDSNKELIALRTNEAGVGVADYYTWQDGVFEQKSTAPLSMNMAELSQQGWVTGGMLRDGVPALFVTGVEIGVQEMPRVVYDILTEKNGDLVNAVLSTQTGVSSEIARFCSLYPSDINNNGITETPWPILPDEETVPTDPGHGFVEWRSYDTSGKSVVELATYHDLADGWYLKLPKEWKGRIVAVRTVQEDEAVITFSIRGKRGQEDQPFLRITALTGHNRMVKAVRGNRVSLGRNANGIYVAELLEPNTSWAFGVTENEVRAAFSLIKPEWSIGDN